MYAEQHPLRWHPSRTSFLFFTAKIQTKGGTNNKIPKRILLLKKKQELCVVLYCNNFFTTSTREMGQEVQIGNKFVRKILEKKKNFCEDVRRLDYCNWLLYNSFTTSFCSSFFLMKHSPF
jgi:hypothetical protein